jgi:hypothetical protein
LRRFFVTLIVIGGLGFFGAFLLPRLGHRLDQIELPTLLGTTTIELPDGMRLTATVSTQRLQLYAKDGHFQNGWFVNAKGAYSASV